MSQSKLLSKERKEQAFEALLNERGLLLCESPEHCGPNAALIWSIVEDARKIGRRGRRIGKIGQMGKTIAWSRDLETLKRSYHKRATARSVVTTTVGFIRVRKRKLKPKYEWYKPSRGMYAGIGRKREIPNSSVESLSYDLVRAVRINGEPRHKFVLGFGSPA